MSARKFDGEWMPLFGDWLLESERVDDLSDPAFRLYLWLLWRQWKHESIPTDPSSIVPARFAKRWRALWSEVEQFFAVGGDGRRRNETCAMLRADAEERRGKTSQRGRNGAAATNAKRWGDRRSSDRPSDSASDAQPISQASLVGRTVPYSTEPDQPPVVPLTGDGPGSSLEEAEPESPQALELRAWWCSRFKAITGEGYPWRERTDGRAAEAVLELSGGDLQRVRDVAERLFADPFHRRTGFDLGTLRTQWAKLIAAKPVESSAPSAVTPREEKPAWKRLGYESEQAYLDRFKFANEPKPKLLDMLHAQRNGAAVAAGGAP